MSLALDAHARIGQRAQGRLASLASLDCEWTLLTGTRRKQRNQPVDAKIASP